MKKRIYYIIFFLFSLIVLPNGVRAISVSVNCSSNNIYVGDTITCRISGSATQVSAVKGNLSYSSNLTFLSGSKVSCANGEVGPSKFDCIDELSPGSLIVASYVFKANSAGSGNVTVSSGEVVDESFNPKNVVTSSTSITISNRPVIQAPVVKNTSLASVKIDKIPFAFNKGIFNYNFDVNYDIDSVKVNYQKGDNEQNVLLSGNESLKPGLNIIKLTVKNGTYVSTYTFNINKREEYITISFIDNDKLKGLLNSDSNSKLIVEVKDVNDKLINYETLKIIKEKKKKVIYKVFNKDSELYSITFDGNKIESVSSYFDLNLLLNSSDLKLTDKYYNFDLSQKNKIKGSVELSFNNSILTKEAYLYIVENNQYKYIDKISITDKVKIDINDFNNYVLIQSKIDGSKKENTATSNKINLVLYIVIGVLVLSNIICIIILLFSKNKKIINVGDASSYINDKNKYFGENKNSTNNWTNSEDVTKSSKNSTTQPKQETVSTETIEIIGFDDISSNDKSNGDTK